MSDSLPTNPSERDVEDQSWERFEDGLFSPGLPELGGPAESLDRAQSALAHTDHHDTPAGHSDVVVEGPGGGGVHDDNGTVHTDDAQGDPHHGDS